MNIGRYNGIRRSVPPQKLAEGLGWFSIGLGLAEVLMPGMLARGIGMRGKEGVLRAYGVREIATGIGILTARDKQPWIWGRVGGDALDIVTVAGLAEGNGRGAPILAMGAVMGVTALDVLCAESLAGEQNKPAYGPVRDYSDRSGFPRPASEMRGAARREPKSIRSRKPLPTPSDTPAPVSGSAASQANIANNPA